MESIFIFHFQNTVQEVLNVAIPLYFYGWNSRSVFQDQIGQNIFRCVSLQKVNS